MITKMITKCLYFNIAKDVWPNGGVLSCSVLGEWIAPQLEHIYATQNLPALLPGMQDSPDGCQK